jgi:hypothetical protein
VQWVEQHQPGAVAVPQERPQIAEVADAPAVRRVQRVELHHPTPGLRRFGQAVRHHDQRHVLPPGGQAVPAERQIRRYLGHRPGRAVFEIDRSRLGERPRRAMPYHQRAGQRRQPVRRAHLLHRVAHGLRCGGVDAEQREHPDDRFGGYRATLPVPVLV